MLRQIMTNGFLPIIPILVWNWAFTSRLPAAFSPDTFNRNIPLLISVGENVFRFAVFLMPLSLRLDIATSTGKVGLGVFLFGLALYFLSWLVLIYAPASPWSTSVLGFCAPAYTPIIWLIGICLMADSYYFRVSYSWWHYMVPAACFSLFHVLHTLQVFGRTRTG